MSDPLGLTPTLTPISSDRGLPAAMRAYFDGFYRANLGVKCRSSIPVSDPLGLTPRLTPISSGRGLPSAMRSYFDEFYKANLGVKCRSALTPRVKPR